MLEFHKLIYLKVYFLALYSPALPQRRGAYQNGLPIDRCRKADDWDKVYEMLDTYVAEMDAILKKTPNDKNVYKKQVNLEFSIDRLLDYINKYSAFVSQGEKYYQKFNGIVSTYENQAACAGKLPKQFGDLQKDIDISIEKFNNSYNISELKDLFYGSSLDN